MRPFVHLHLHTAYSLLDGTCRVDQIMEAAAEHGMSAVAMTDHGAMYGAVDFYKQAKARGIKPIIGCETYVAYGSRKERKGDENKVPAHHLVLLATDETGYRNLIRLVSLAHLEGFYYKPRIDKELLAAHSKGLIGLSACLKGEVTASLVENNPRAAEQAAGQYAEIFGKDSFFIEIQDHNLPEQRRTLPQLEEVARKTGLRLVATNDVHYLRKEHASAHEVLLCLQTQNVLSDKDHMRMATEEFYLKSGDEMARLFARQPEALDTTLEIAERCNMEFTFGAFHFPSFQAPGGMSQRDYLERVSLDGLQRLYGIRDPRNPQDQRERDVMARFRTEMDVITNTAFVNYFLVVWDFVHFAKQQGIPVGPGRGSGAGSLVAYALGITGLDPLRYGLIFERFLNPERISPPDFDIDFCQARRGEVIEYVKNKYGRENVAQIITFGSLGAKLVIRDVGRVLEIPFAECDRLAKMVPEDPKMNLKKALELNPEFKRAYETEESCKRILNYAMVLEGLYRNPGTHAAGVVISPRPLLEMIPLARDKDGEPVTQYSMEPLGELGLLKMDFLGLKTLTVIRESVDLIRATRGVELDIDNLAFDDKPTYDLLNRGDTVGVFQLESGGMRDLIRRIGIGGIEDLIAMIALYRPGPMNMLDDYVARKTGKAKISYDHPLLEPILKETYGVMLYQEQVQKAANVLAGYSLGQADVLRRAMGKKKASEMQKQRQTFVDGCKKCHNISPKQAGSIFDNMEKFAGYGFNKAHSAGYAIISYQTAYLKANYPAEFMSALLSSEMGNADKLPVFIAESVAMDLKILAPDLNASGVRFGPDGRAIRFGFAGIKNVGEGAAAAIVAERERGGPYQGLIDFCSRIDGQLCNKKVIESLVRSGAFDSVNPDRARLFNAIDFAMQRAARTLRDRRSGQGDLFSLLGGGGGGEGGPAAPAGEDLPPCDPWHESTMLAGERELLGIYMSGHPLSQYEPLLKRYRLATIADLETLEDHALTRLGGIASQVAKKVTKQSKEMMAIVQLEDVDGTTEVLLFPDAYREFGVYAEQDAAVLVCGEVSRRDDPPKLIAYELYPLIDAPRYFAQRLKIHLPATTLVENRLERIRGILGEHPGTTSVVICLQFPSGEKVFLEADKRFQVLASEDLVHALEHELGENSVYVEVNPTPCRKARARRSFGNGGGGRRKED